LGSSLSRRFSKEYKVVLLARSQGTLDTVCESIKKAGGEVIHHLNTLTFNSRLDSRRIVSVKSV
jgi:hypothetical protein